MLGACLLLAALLICSAGLNIWLIGLNIEHERNLSRHELIISAYAQHRPITTAATAVFTSPQADPSQEHSPALSNHDPTLVNVLQAFADQQVQRLAQQEIEERDNVPT